MKNPDELLNKHAKIHMKQWDLKQFKLKYPSLYKVFVGAINEAREVIEIEPINPYIVGQLVDGLEIIESECGGFHKPSGIVYHYCKLVDGSYRDTSIDDVPISEQKITKTP